MGPLLLAFTLLPFVELYLLIRIGKVVGAGPTLLFVIAVGVLGAALAKVQGRRVINSFRSALAEGRVPEQGVLDGILILVGALLLITPGVVTDVVGLLCFLPPVRRAIANKLRNNLAEQIARGQTRMQVYGFNLGASPRTPTQRASTPRPREPLRRDDVIDTEGEEV